MNDLDRTINRFVAAVVGAAAFLVAVAAVAAALWTIWCIIRLLAWGEL